MGCRPVPIGKTLFFFCFGVAFLLPRVYSRGYPKALYNKEGEGTEHKSRAMKHEREGEACYDG